MIVHRVFFELCESSFSRDRAHHSDHFRGGFGGALTGVAVGATGAVFGLLLGFGGEHAKDDWECFIDRDLCNAARRLAGHVIKMGCIPANHATKANDGMESFRPRGGFCRHRQLECARYTEHFNLLFLGAKFLQSCDTSSQQFIDDMRIESRRDHRNMSARGNTRLSRIGRGGAHILQKLNRAKQKVKHEPRDDLYRR